MRKWGAALAALALTVPLGACVETRQYADVQFTVPQGQYKLLVLRPDHLTAVPSASPAGEGVSERRRFSIRTDGANDPI